MEKDKPAINEIKIGVWVDKSGATEYYGDIPRPFPDSYYIAKASIKEYEEEKLKEAMATLNMKPYHETSGPFWFGFRWGLFFGSVTVLIILGLLLLSGILIKSI